MRKLSAYGPSLMVLVTALLVLFLGPRTVEHLTYKQTEARMIQASSRLESDDLLARLNQAYKDIAAFVEPSVVHITAQQVMRDRSGVTSLSSGSGWIYDAEGHIVTNHHVVRDADRIEVQLKSGRLRQAEIIGYDGTTDIAVLAIQPGHLHPAVRADTNDTVDQGDLVFAFGSPFDFRFSMSSGIVSGKGRSVDVLGSTGYENFIQVDAAINPGNSGGPLTDYRGRVIGMNTAIATGRRGSLDEGQFAGIGLAIPLEMIEPVVSQIIETGFVEKGFLGVSVAELKLNEAQDRYGFVGGGVWIWKIEEDSPAARAGIQVNDIVTAVDGAEVASTDQLRSLISSMLPGEVAELTIYRPDLEHRTGTSLTLSVRLDRLDMLRSNGAVPENQSSEQIVQLGIMRMRTSTPAAAADLGVPFHPGVLIEQTLPGSDLAAQVEPGSIIVEVRGRPIENVDQLLALLRGYNLLIGAHANVLLPDGRSATVILRVQE